MAIRAGTGGLKYPLPANTDVQASIAAASSGGSAAASAYGANRQFAANRMRVQADLANSAAERQFRALSQMGEQQFRAQQNYFDREHSKGSQLEAQQFSADQQAARLQAQKESQWESQYFQAERDRQERDFTTKRDEAQFDRRQQEFEIARDAGIEDGIRGGNLELSPAAQQEMQKLEEGRVAAKDLDPVQREEFEQQYQIRRRELLRTARPPQGPTPSQRMNQNTAYVGPDGKAYDEPGEGRTAINVETGKPLIEKPDTSKEDDRRQKWLDETADELTGSLKDPKDPSKGRWSPEEAAAESVKMWESREKGFGAKQATAPGAVETLPALPPNTPVPPGVVGTQPALPPNTPVPPGVVSPAQQEARQPGLWQGPVQRGQEPRPTTQQEYDAIPSGMTYLDKDGNLKRKK